MKKLSSDRPTQAKFTLLTISADVDDFRSIRHILNSEKYALRQAHSCREAAACLAQERPSVIVCDHNLSDGSWRDIFAQVRELHDPPPVIVISRHADERLWAEVLNVGGYDVLAKPLESLEVSRVLGSACLSGQHHAILQSA